MKLVVIVFGKFAIALLKLLGKSGSALPGLIVEKLYPKLLEKQLDQLEKGVIVVTGTNGKTTTTKALVYLLEQSGLRVLTNPTGSNFTRGVYATLLKYSSWTGQMNYDIAVLELDEAFSRRFAKRYNPNYVLALNVMRDQLDRYGEIDTTAQMIGETISYAKKGAILNADDKRIADLASKSQAEVFYFSIDPRYRSEVPTDDEMHIKHPKRIKHKKHGLRSVAILAGYDHGHIAFQVDDGLFHTSTKIAGLHNALNITAALSTALVVAPQMEPQFLVPTIKDIPTAFGRGEVITAGNAAITLVLVKNPSGLRQSLRSYSHEKYDEMIFAINDDFADGRDVSWLWDVDFSSIRDKQHVTTSGVRGYDMALRLQYDDKPSETTEEIDILVDRLVKSEQISTTIVYCTYTAMLALRKSLARYTKVEDIW